LVSGDEVYRKNADHELKNLKFLNTACIMELSTSLCTIVDFRSQRFLCQAVIPGVLGIKNSSRLLHGIVNYVDKYTVRFLLLF
jgi:hypothetical protein